MDANGGRNGEELAELRSLLVGPEKARIDSLNERLNDPELLAEHIGNVLPAAVRISSSRGGKLKASLQPMVEESIRLSVQRNPAILADALFPVIGAAVRKAVASALQGMAESLNQMVEQSLSVRALQWRLEAIRTGKPYGEILLVRSLLYRVEQVFLIHRKTGLVLLHRAADAGVGRDADMISAMLTAIQDFVRDSFRLEQGDELETVQIGPFSLWIHSGPKAMIAGVVRGTPPKQLKIVFQETLEKICREQSTALDAFQGDASPFEPVQPHLDACLLGRRETAERSSYRAVWAFAGILAMLLLVWAGIAYRSRQKWANYLDALSNEPGIVLTRVEAKGGRHFISGLRDELAIDPASRLSAAGLSGEDAVFRWEPFHSLNAPFVARREMEARRRAIEKSLVIFKPDSAEIPTELESSIHQVAEEIRALLAAGTTAGREATVEVFGSTDPSGTAARNAGLAGDRAKTVVEALTSAGIPAAVLKAEAVPETNATARRRAVTFRVAVR